MQTLLYSKVKCQVIFFFILKVPLSVLNSLLVFINILIFILSVVSDLKLALSLHQGKLDIRKTKLTVKHSDFTKIF